MRPGPGLVVMALAFISGARRASTSSSSNSLTIPTILATTTTRTPTAAAVAAAAATGTTATINTAAPAFAIGTTIPSAASSSAAATLPSSYDSEQPSSSGRESSFNFNAGGGFSFLLPTLRRYDGSPGDAGGSPVVLAHNFDFYRRPAPAPDPDTALASSTRRARSLDEGRAGQGLEQSQGQGQGPGTESGASVPESSEATLLGEGNEEQGVPVQYASSRAFDEETETESDAEPDADVVADEDIFALVAEDDLLSEESFDRLIKLSEDAETEAAEEDDYNLAASLALTQQQQEQPQRQSQSQQEHEQEQEHQKQQQQQEEHQESDSQQQDEQSRLVDESVLHAEHNENSREQDEQHETAKENSNNNKRETGEERSRENDAYASHLIAVAQRDGGNLPAPAVGKTTSVAKVDGEANAEAAGSSVAVPVDYRKSILGTASSLTRLNPWISACDLAQPGTTGTDLQVSSTI